MEVLSPISCNSWSSLYFKIIYLQPLSSDRSSQSNSLLHLLSSGIHRLSDVQVNWNSVHSEEIIIQDYNFILYKQSFLQKISFFTVMFRIDVNVFDHLSNVLNLILVFHRIWNLRNVNRTHCSSVFLLAGILYILLFWIYLKYILPHFTCVAIKRI